MGNPFGIMLDPAWAKWATEHGVSETVTAALFLLSEKRKADEVVVKLKPNELELVIEVVQQSPECFPPAAFAALKDSRPTPPEASAPSDLPGAGRNPYGIELDDGALRWAAAEGVPELVIAAICLLSERSVDEIVAKLSPVELEQVIKIVGRSPRGYPPGAYEALKGMRNLAQPERLALKPGQPAARTNHSTEHSRARRFNVGHSGHLPPL